MYKNLLKNSKQDLVDEIIKLREELEKEKQKIKELEGKLNKNSSNSSKPSATEGFKKNTGICNSRKTSKKKRGGQKGHTGKNLDRIEKVDETEDITPKECTNCGENLAKDFAKIIKKSVRQLIDIYTPSMFVKDYIGNDIKCPKCGFVNKSIFPEGVTKPVQYGPKIKAFTSYMYNHQMPSYERLQEFFKEVVGLKISQTSLCNFNKTGYENLSDFEDKLKQVLIKQSLLHADETGVRVAGKLDRIHVNSNENLTYLFPHKKRGREAIEDMGVLNNFEGNCITDGFKSYITYNFFHYLCNAHHLRELKWVVENEKKKWAKQYISFLMKYKKLKDKLMLKGTLSFEKNILDEINIQHTDILTRGKLEYTKQLKRKKGQRGVIKKDKGLNLLERLEKNKDGVLGFLHDFSIPFDNNLAERDLRMVKTRTKISGCFRSTEGTEWFCRIRSYISTLRKQNIEVYSALQSVYSSKLLLPEF